MSARPTCYGQHHDDDRCADCHHYDACLEAAFRRELGTIEWHSPWRQYVFFPADLTYWSAGCLRDLQEQISRLMAERRERR